MFNMTKNLTNTVIEHQLLYGRMPTAHVLTNTTG